MRASGRLMRGCGGHVLCDDLGKARVADLHRPRPQPASRPYRTPGGGNSHCMQLSLPVPAHACHLDRSDLASNRPEFFRHRHPGQTRWFTLTARHRPSGAVAQCPGTTTPAGLTFNRMQQNILFRPSPKIKNKPFLSELNNFRDYLCKDNFRIICICLRFCLHIIGICNNATPFSDGERSRPQFQDPLYGSARFLEHAHGFVPSMLAFYILSLARKLPMHLQPHPACKACCHCRSMRRPCCSMVVAGR